jgi:hypothetical protein
MDDIKFPFSLGKCYFFSHTYCGTFYPPTVPTKRDLHCGAQSIIWNTDGGREARSHGRVGMVGAPSSGIELVLSNILFR